MRILAVLAFLAVTPALAQEVSVTDTTGVEIRLPAPAAKVVAINKSAYVTAVSLGITPVAAVVAANIRSVDVYHPEGESIPDVSAENGWSPDPELIAAVKPDLILGWSNDDRPALELSAPYYAFAGLTDLDSFVAMTRDIGRLTGREEKAEELIKAYEDRLAAYAKLVPSRLRGMSLDTSGEAESFGVSTAHFNPECAVIDAVARCDWENPTGEAGYFETSIEGVLDLDPDVILLSVWPFEEQSAVYEKLQANPLWNELRAVKEGRIVLQPGPIAFQADSILGLTHMLDEAIPAIYPETFPNGPLTEAEVAAALAP